MQKQVLIKHIFPQKGYVDEGKDVIMWHTEVKQKDAEKWLAFLKSDLCINIWNKSPRASLSCNGLN